MGCAHTIVRARAPPYCPKICRATFALVHRRTYDTCTSNTRDKMPHTPWGENFRVDFSPNEGRREAQSAKTMALEASRRGIEVFPHQVDPTMYALALAPSPLSSTFNRAPKCILLNGGDVIRICRTPINRHLLIARKREFRKAG